MAWTNLSFSFGSLLTSAKMTQLYDNLTALANGDSGAPPVTQAGVGAAAVGQGELKTTTASGSTAIAGNGSASVSLTGGTYSWWTGGANPGSGITIGFGNTDTAAGVLGLSITGIAATFFRDERYVQASPPYDLGDGEVPLFIYALIDNATGEIVNLEVARDPTWAYHGPTIITPTRVDRVNKKKFREEFVIADSGMTIAQAKKDNPKLFNDWLDGKKQAAKHEIEITSEYKNSDMETHPHPWCYNKPEYFAGKTVVMIDPFDPMMQRFFEIQQTVDAKTVHDIIKENFSIKNEAINRKAPRALTVHKLKMKGT